MKSNLAALELERSSYAMFHENANPSLLAALKTRFAGIEVAYVLHWIPEQAEDLYEVAIEGGLVAIIEIERATGLVVNQRVFSRTEYEARIHSREKKRKFQAALRLFQAKN